MLSLNDIRKTIISEQKICLDIIWDYTINNDSWMPEHLLKRQLRLSNKPEYFDTFKSINKQIVLTGKNDYIIYSLSFLGTLLTSRGIIIQTNYIRLLEYLREQIDKIPGDKIKSEKIKNDLQFSNIELTEIGKLIKSNSFTLQLPVKIQGYSGAFKDNLWSIELTPQMEDLYLKAIEDYFEEQAVNPFDQNINSELPNSLFTSINKKQNIFIGHGNSQDWFELRDFLKGKLMLECLEYNSQPVAGIPITERLNQMLESADFAFMVMTAEDAHSDGTIHTRENVIHETGLFQAKLGFNKTIILLENGCSEYSNIKGLNQIRFGKKQLSSTFSEIVGVLKREGII